VPPPWTEILSIRSLFAIGVTFLAFGIVLWILPIIARRMFEIRRNYAAGLRAAGEEERAEKLEAETANILRRVPALGKLFVAIGISATVVAMLFAPQ